MNKILTYMLKLWLNVIISIIVLYYTLKNKNINNLILIYFLMFLKIDMLINIRITG